MQNDIILKSPDKFLNVVQEQINNIVKHASAKNVLIRLRSNQARIFLLIEDDGKGLIQKTKNGYRTIKYEKQGRISGWRN